jgi:hypothetical protein
MSEAEDPERMKMGFTGYQSGSRRFVPGNFRFFLLGSGVPPAAI